MFLNVNNVGAERMCSGRLFQATGPATQNARLPSCCNTDIVDMYTYCISRMLLERFEQSHVRDNLDLEIFTNFIVTVC